MFRNRNEAGRQLAERLKHLALKKPLVLAIPRGGVAVGAALAQELQAELDVVLSSKLRAPQQPELAFGAISENGEVYLDPDASEMAELDEEYFHRERVYQTQKIARRRELFRTVRPIADPRGRSVIVTDDGIATGSTMIAALQLLRTQRPAELIVAVPVAPPDRLAILHRWCDDVVCLMAPHAFISIGQFYEDFSHVEDLEAVKLVRQAYLDQPGTPIDAHS